MPSSNTAPKRANWKLLSIIALVVAALASVGVLSAKAVTESVANDQAAERTRAFQEQAACISEWGEGVVNTIQIRSKATARLERVESAKDRAFDEIIRTATLLNRTPPEATAEESQAALERANQLRLRVAEVRLEVADTRADNEYPAPPTLTCAITDTND